MVAIEMREGFMGTPLTGSPEVSKNRLSEMALGGAIQFERAIAGMSADVDVIRRLASSLHAIGSPSWSEGPVRYVAPGYWAPLESIVRSHRSGEATVEEVQAYVEKVASDLSNYALGGGEVGNAADLRDACLAIHEGLIQDLISEAVSAVDWQVESRGAPASFREA